jgi:hypothetical protein
MAVMLAQDVGLVELCFVGARHGVHVYPWQGYQCEYDVFFIDAKDLRR